jgi:hypothetical protein
MPICDVTHIRSILHGMKKTSGSPASELRLVARGIRADSRKRLALGRALDDLDDASFNVYRDEQGRIILDPQVSIPASEAWLYRNKKALQSVRRGLSQAADGKTARAGSFAKYADDES